MKGRSSPTGHHAAGSGVIGCISPGISNYRLEGIIHRLMLRVEMRCAAVQNAPNIERGSYGVGAGWLLEESWCWLYTAGWLAA